MVADLLVEVEYIQCILRIVRTRWIGIVVHVGDIVVGVVVAVVVDVFDVFAAVDIVVDVVVVVRIVCAVYVSVVAVVLGVQAPEEEAGCPK